MFHGKQLKRSGMVKYVLKKTKLYKLKKYSK